MGREQEKEKEKEKERYGLDGNSLSKINMARIWEIKEYCRIINNVSIIIIDFTVIIIIEKCC
jgi:hypothetical protein